ncbi:DMT family transporter [Plastorhodobacter daqingensis]|uniref:DMT family transporter n=1 Tax=Plastorhodobacter daqingensis TaxID=1387281 RepID=A0ABW2UKP2_9RHOB
MDAAPAHRPVAGILWMFATGFSFVAMTAGVKHVGAEVPAAQSAFLRFALGLVFLLPLVGQITTLRPGRTVLWLTTLRGIVHTGAVILWFYAMTQIPLAEVTAMNYLNPIYVTLGAALFLGEKLALRRLIAVGAALLGALIILRPGFREISPGHIAMLGTAAGLAASYLVAKRLSSELNASTVVALLSLTVTIMLAPFAWAVWVPVTGHQLFWLFLVAGFATLGHYTMTRAFAAAPVTVTQPVTFLQLLWATLLGALVFGEAVDGWVILGGGIIMSAVLFITWREAVIRRRAVTPALDVLR